MAILAIVVGPEIKKDHYEMLRKEVRWEQHQPEGLIFHAAAFDASGGLHVADVWTSVEAMDQYFDTSLLPALIKLKLALPAREIYPLHAAMTGDGVEQFKPKLLVH